MPKELFFIALCMALCFATFGFFYLRMHRRGIDYVHYFVRTTVYFLGIGILTSLVFHAYIVRALEPISWIPIVVFVVVMSAQLFLSIYVPQHFPAPVKYFAEFPDRYFLQVDWRRFISKSADIFSQQVFIVVLIYLLSDVGLTLTETVFAFGALFALLHVPLIASEFGAWPSWLFGTAVVCFSVIFPILILRVPYGFVYTYLIHWMFYTVTATVFWMVYARRRSAGE